MAPVACPLFVPWCPGPIEALPRETGRVPMG